MRQTIGGDGQDTTAAVVAWLLANNELFLADLFLIGEPDDPFALWLTNWESGLVWSPWGTFNRGVISRGTVSTKIGLEAEKIEIRYTPTPQEFTESMETASPYQRCRAGLYDNQPVRVWTAFMPTKGDADTFGAAPLYGGRIGEQGFERGELVFSCNSFLDVLNQMVPLNVIELTNTLAGYMGATPPEGESTVPKDIPVLSGTTTTLVKTSHSFPDHSLRGGFLVFAGEGGMTLGGIFSAIADNVDNAGTQEITLYTPTPWAATPGTDTFYVSAQAPMNADENGYAGFPYVPVPTSAI